MAYNCAIGQCDGISRSGCYRVQRFSNPNFLYNGKAMGNAQHDNARQINAVAATVAGYFDEVEVATGPPPDNSCPAGKSKIEVTINTDSYPGETSWSINDECSQSVIMTGGPYNTGGSTYTATTDCVPDNKKYSFTMKDSYGDGNCCGKLENCAAYSSIILHTHY